MAEPSILANLTNPGALAALALIIPIVLLYLLKPKPKLVPFPSTMFIRFIEKNKRFTSFLQRFIHDPLLLMQILIITLLVLAVVDPFYMSKQEQREEEAIVLVFDASASMQATDASPNRFAAAIEKARELIADFNKNDEVSIILAENIPAVVSSKASPDAASAALGGLKVSDTTTNVGDAMMLAHDMLSASDRKRVIYVLSDFAPSGGMDPQLARKIALVAGMHVELLKIGTGGANAGIVSLDAKRSSTNGRELYLTASVRNYDSGERKVAMKVLSGDKVLASDEKAVGAGGEGFFYLKPNITDSEQIIRVEVTGGDELALDDAAYAFIPAIRVRNILFLTSAGSDSYLTKVLESIKNVRVNATTTFIPHDLSGYDLIILGNFKPEQTLAGDFRNIRDSVQKGAGFVVVGTENMGRIRDPDFWSIMPVDLEGAGSRETPLDVVQEHDILTDVVFDTVTVKKYYNAKVRDNQTKTLIGAHIFENPMIAYRPIGDGNIVYVGVNSDPEWSNLYYSSSFPILWSQMIGYFTKQRATASINSLHTGDYLQLPQALDVETPEGGRIYSASIFLDKAGVYRVSYPDKTDQVPVNLLDSMESNITGSVQDVEDGAGYRIKRQELDVKVETYRPLLFIMLLGLVVEVWLYRRRGLI